MKFSTKSSYGLRAIIHLAKNYGKNPLSLAKISRIERISLAYLERLFSQLKKANLVVSSKGITGGYQLAKSPAKITVFEIIQALEGQISVFRCVGTNSKIFCGIKTCPSVKVYQKVQKALVKSLKSMTLKDLI